MWIPSVLGLQAGAVMCRDSICTFLQLSNLKLNCGLFCILIPSTVRFELMKNLMACKYTYRISQNLILIAKKICLVVKAYFFTHNWAVTWSRQCTSIRSLLLYWGLDNSFIRTCTKINEINHYPLYIVKRKGIKLTHIYTKFIVHTLCGLQGRFHHCSPLPSMTPPPCSDNSSTL